MKLIFQDSRKEERVIAYPNSKKEVICEINKFLKDRNFKICYMRVWECEERLMIDVGSHSEFFLVEDITFNEWIGNWKEKKFPRREK